MLMIYNADFNDIVFLRSKYFEFLRMMKNYTQNHIRNILKNVCEDLLWIFDQIIFGLDIQNKNISNYLLGYKLYLNFFKFIATILKKSSKIKMKIFDENKFLK